MSPEELQAMGDAASRVWLFHTRLADLPTEPELESDLARDEAATQSEVHPARMAALMVERAADCMVGAFNLMKPENAAGVAPVEVLLRSALVASARTAFMLSPDNDEERRANETTIARMDAGSARSAWTTLGTFEHTIIRASEARDRVFELTEWAGTDRAPGEATIIGRMIEAVTWRLHDPAEQPLLRERLYLMWHGLSGVAHANTWQAALHYRGAEDALATTGPLVDNVVTITMSVDFCIGILDQRLRARKAQP